MTFANTATVQGATLKAMVNARRVMVMGGPTQSSRNRRNSVSKRDINAFVAMQCRWGMVWAGLQVAACLVGLVTLVMFRGLA